MRSAATPHTLVFTASYLRFSTRFLKRHPDIKRQYDKTIALLELDPHHPSLRLHRLSGKHDGLHPVSINLSYRLTMEFLLIEREIIPVNVGDHDAVYS